MRKLVAVLILAAAFVAGLARGQDGGGLSAEAQQKLAQVRREVKHIDLESSARRVPDLVAREREYEKLVKEAYAAASKGEGGVPGVLERARELKLAALEDLNTILKKHTSEHSGISEEEVHTRLRNARFAGVSYRDEWLVNILDDLETKTRINIELDTRVYKFDTVSIDFDKASARSMLQIMGDTLLFEWIVRGDTLYVYKENHEVLFGGEWIRQKKRAWKARKEAFEAAIKEAEGKALEEGGDGR